MLVSGDWTASQESKHSVITVGFSLKHIYDFIYVFCKQLDPRRLLLCRNIYERYTYDKI